MIEKRATWFEAFESIVQFYPRLATTIAFGAMAAAGRMMQGPVATAIGPATTHASELHTAVVPHAAERRRFARKISKHASRKTPKRTKGRRKAA